jgi:histidine triad (HIT) family protein
MAQDQLPPVPCALSTAYNDNNPFAKIIRGEIPRQVVFEDAHVLAFMPLDAAAAGHTLVIPKRAVRSLLDMTPEEMGQVLDVARRVGIAQQKALGATGFKIAQNNGPGAQDVCHAHFHVIPLFDNRNSRPGDYRPTVPRAEQETMAARLSAGLPAR